MSMYWNQRTRALNPYVPGEQPQNRKFIKLNTNENPYPPPPPVLRALRKAVDPALRLYPDPEAGELKALIAEKYGVEPDQVFLGNGSDEILAFAFAAFFESEPAAEEPPAKGGRAKKALPGPAPAPAGTLPPPILFPDITYSFYPVFAELWGIPYETPALAEDFTLDPKDYKRPCGGVVLASPNTPTGIALETPALRAVIKYQEQRHRVVILDQAYAAFSQGGEIKTAKALVQRYSNLLTVHSLSKASSLAGLRVGFAIGSKELIEGLRRVRDSFNSYTLDRLAQAGALAAVKAARYYKGLAQRVIATRDRVSGALAKMKVQVIPSQANFLLIRFPGMEGAKVLAALKKKGILARHFNQPRISDYIRVTIGTDEEMDAFLEQCRELAGAPAAKGRGK
jgi:histidinol-phosphate aminotransferase